MVDTNQCWLYAGYIRKDGYGEIQSFFDGKWFKLRVHRVMYESLVGDIPDKLVLDHLCRNPSCINPQHLDPVTDKVNILRGLGTGAQYAKRTHCNHGHPLSGNNLLTLRNRRRCRECYNKQRREWWHRNKRDAMAG